MSFEGRNHEERNIATLRAQRHRYICFFEEKKHFCFRKISHQELANKFASCLHLHTSLQKLRFSPCSQRSQSPVLDALPHCRFGHADSTRSGLPQVMLLMVAAASLLHARIEPQPPGGAASSFNTCTASGRVSGSGNRSMQSTYAATRWSPTIALCK